MMIWHEQRGCLNSLQKLLEVQPLMHCWTNSAADDPSPFSSRPVHWLRKEWAVRKASTASEM
ncbi:hypothetical protein JOD01_001044 [Brevibacillus fulvus]|uniref:Uncharacterized protein n=1 Tax=Brevibacillus fulvus TaxID=1125967 RepID=A0A938XZU2_9BACL|nr:hypothetical protein [Brevibacillus fulvus]